MTEWIARMRTTAYLEVMIINEGQVPTIEEINDASNYSRNHLESYVDEYELIEVTMSSEEGADEN
jgi:hypothetical protein